MPFVMRFFLALLLGCFALATRLPGQVERFIAIDNVCAWPNLTLLADGTILVTIFNQPSHATVEGDVEVWASTDGGRLWSRRGVAAPHEPGTMRMNVGAGLAHDGALIVLAGGWKGRLEAMLTPWVCRSTDGGRTWDRSGTLNFPAGTTNLTPFGNVIQLPGRRLAAPFYERLPSTPTGPGGTAEKHGRSHILFSEDDGRTWGQARTIATGDYSETFALRLAADRWLAAVRKHNGSGWSAELEQFSSADEGITWKSDGKITLPGNHPGHYLRLADGRLLLSYSIRERQRVSTSATTPDATHQAIGIRLSEDQGRTWGVPARIVTMEGATDGGYPSTVQLADGTLVTAYYADRLPQHNRYHMGVVRWRLDPVPPRKAK